MNIKKLIESIDKLLEPATFTDDERKNLKEVVEVIKNHITFDKVIPVGTGSQGTFEYDFEKDGKTLGHCEIINSGIRIRLFHPELNIIVKDAKEAEEKLNKIS